MGVRGREDVRADDSGTAVAWEVPYTPFIITAMGRDGSNWLGQLIENHPTAKVRWDNELLMFHGDNARKYAHYQSAESLLKDTTYNPDADELDAAGLKYTPTMLGGRVNTAVTDSLHCLYKLRPPIRVIHLERRNLLRALVSLRVAQQTNIWRIDHWRPPGYGDYRRPRIHITLEEFMFCVKSRLERYAGLRREFGGYPSLTICYEDLRSKRDHWLRMVYEFLGLDPDVPLPEDTTQRQEFRSLSESISNYDKLKSLLRGTRWEILFD